MLLGAYEAPESVLESTQGTPSLAAADVTRRVTLPGPIGKGKAGGIGSEQRGVCLRLDNRHLHPQKISQVLQVKITHSICSFLHSNFFHLISIFPFFFVWSSSSKDNGLNLVLFMFN